MPDFTIWGAGSATGLVVTIPPEHVAAFKEVVRRGMSFEHGEPLALHRFADKLAQIDPPPMTPGGSLFV